MVNVTQQNFLEQSNDFIVHLPKAAFVALDEEMTGIHLTTPAGSSSYWQRDCPPAESYPNAGKLVAERFTILQLGICLFLPADSHHKQSSSSLSSSSSSSSSTSSSSSLQWKIRRYNFYMFPDPSIQRDVILASSTARFLSQHNMSFDTWIKDGIPFQTLTRTEELLQEFMTMQQQYHDDETKYRAKSKKKKRRNESPRIILTKPQDQEFLDDCLARIQAWLPTSKDEKKNNNNNSPNHYSWSSLILPECNSFLRRVLYEHVGYRYPDLELEAGGPCHPNCLRVWLPSSSASNGMAAARIAQRQREDWEHFLAGTIGMTRIFAALQLVCRGYTIDKQSLLFATRQDRIGDLMKRQETGLSPLLAVEQTPQRSSALTERPRIPLIVHYGFMDLLFLLTHFVTPTLPPTLSECKALLHLHFPIIFDTKVMAAEKSSCKYNDPHSSLGDTFHRVTMEDENGDLNLRDSLAVDQDDDHESTQMHEASYDAFMTGVCFLALCRDIQSNAVPGMWTQDSAAQFYYPLIKSGYRENSRKILQPVFGRNQLYQSSIYTIDLEEKDMDRLQRGLFLESTFRVSGVEGSIRQFTQQVQEAYDSMHTAPLGQQQQKGKYPKLNVQRLEPGSFLVCLLFESEPVLVVVDGTLSLESRWAKVQKEGSKLKSALVDAIPDMKDCTILRLDEYLLSKQKEAAKLKQNNVASSLLPNDAFKAMWMRILLSWFRFWGVILGMLPSLMDTFWSGKQGKSRDSSSTSSSLMIRNDVIVDSQLIQHWKE